MDVHGLNGQQAYEAIIKEVKTAGKAGAHGCAA